MARRRFVSFFHNRPGDLEARISLNRRLDGVGAAARGRLASLRIFRVRRSEPRPDRSLDRMPAMGAEPPRRFPVGDWLIRDSRRLLDQETDSIGLMASTASLATDFARAEHSGNRLVRMVLVGDRHDRASPARVEDQDHGRLPSRGASNSGGSSTVCRIVGIIRPRTTSIRQEVSINPRRSSKCRTEGRRSSRDEPGWGQTRD